MHPDNQMMQGFFLRSKGYDSAEGLSKSNGRTFQAATIQTTPSSAAPARRGRYWSPDVAGFSASVGYFEDDEWGAALRYKKEWGETFDVGAGIGYSKNTDERYLTGGGGDANGPNPPFASPNNFEKFNGTSRIGLGPRLSSTSRAACLLSVLSVSRRPTTRTPSIPDFIPAAALPDERLGRPGRYST